MRVLVTGASGFLGPHVCRALAGTGHTVRALGSGPGMSGVEVVPYADPATRALPPDAFTGVDAVIHLAGLAHVRGRPGSRQAFFRANMELTGRIAAAAAGAGVRELLFASSVKAAAERSERPLRESDPPAPRDDYGQSKLEAERRLATVGAARGMRTVSLRLPLMYGAGMKANMLALFRAVDRGLPLPLGGIANRRSLLYAGNAAAAFVRLLGRVEGQEVCYASDGEPVSTPELIERIGAALHRRVRLLPAPRALLRFASRVNVPRLTPMAARLAGSLEVDDSRLRGLLGTPLPFTLDEGLAATAAWYRNPQAYAEAEHAGR